MESRKQPSSFTTPTFGTIKGSIEILRNKYGTDDILALCCNKVTLLNAENQWVGEETTDVDGHFAFLCLELNTMYTVIFPDSVDYDKQKFLPRSEGLQYQFQIKITDAKPVENVEMRYAIPHGSMIQGDSEDALPVPS